MFIFSAAFGHKACRCGVRGVCLSVEAVLARSQDGGKRARALNFNVGMGASWSITAWVIPECLVKFSNMF
jgi:hypothetical protein